MENEEPTTKRNALLVAKELANASDNRLTAIATINEGIRVQVHAVPNDRGTSTAAMSNGSDTSPVLTKGSCLIECDEALNLALDPPRWSTHCGMCTGPIMIPTMTTRADATAVNCGMCAHCQVIGFCSHCLSNQDNLGRHAKECQALKLFLQLVNGSNDSENQEEASTTLPLYLSDLTSHLLTIRLLYSMDPPNNENKRWQRFLCLYASPILDDDEELESIQQIVSAVTKQSTKKDADDNNKATNDRYKTILARVRGCSHAVTDLSLPLGCQTLGRALFWHHSFYNHSCVPNAFLSCNVGGGGGGSNLTTISTDDERTAATTRKLTASVYSIREVLIPNESITLCYIPMSGLARRERQAKLQGNYDFCCQCPACSLANNEDPISLPDDADVDSIREIQYSCNTRLLALVESRASAEKNRREDEDYQTSGNGDDDDDYQSESSSSSPAVDEIENVLSLVRMTQRGIQNQAIPSTHEVSLEAYRLLAMGHSLLGQYSEAIQHHGVFLKHAVQDLMDPVAMASQRLAMARDILAARKHGKYDGTKEFQSAIDELKTIIGERHNWMAALRQEEKEKFDGPHHCFFGDNLSSKKRRVDDSTKSHT